MVVECSPWWPWGVGRLELPGAGCSGWCHGRSVGRSWVGILVFLFVIRGVSCMSVSCRISTRRGGPGGWGIKVYCTPLLQH
jgi:hypothetical protein